MGIFTVAGLTYTAELLRVVAVPAAAFELVSAERRERIESFLLFNLRRAIRSVLLIVLFLWVSTVALVMLGPYLVLLLFALERPLYGYMTVRIIGSGSTGAMMIALSLAGTAFVFLAALLVTVMPPSWIHILSLPFETFSTSVNRWPLVDWLIPDYRSEEFVEHYQTVFKAFEDWLWDWLAWVSVAYFFVAKGLMLVLVILIQVALVAAVGLMLWLIPTVPAYAFTRFSDFLKRKSGIEGKGRIPLGALLVWSVGELLGFALSTAEFLGLIAR